MLHCQILAFFVHRENNKIVHKQLIQVIRTNMG